MVSSRVLSDELHQKGTIVKRLVFSSARALPGKRWTASTATTPRERGIGDGGDEQTLQQTYSPKEVQGAFKVLMTR